MKWSEYFPHRLLQVKLLKCEVELMPKDRRKEALKMRKYQLERLWPFYLPGVVNVTNVWMCDQLAGGDHPHGGEGQVQEVPGGGEEEVQVRDEVLQAVGGSQSWKSSCCQGVWSGIIVSLLPLPTKMSKIELEWSLAGEHVQVGLVLGVYFVRQVAIASASEAMSTGLAEPGKNCQGLQPGNKASNPKCFKKIDLKSPLTLTLARHTFLAELRNCSSRMAMLEGGARWTLLRVLCH